MSWYGDIWNGLTGIPSDAGLTQKPPTDLSKGPDAQRLRDAATLFNDQYNNYNPEGVPNPMPLMAATGADRDRIRAAMDYMSGVAQGTAPSQAELLARQGVTQNQGAQRGIASTLQGPYAGASERAGIVGASMVPQAAASNMAALHADEMMNARQQLADAARGLRSQDIGREQYWAGAQQRQNQMNDAYRLGLGNLTRSSLAAPYDAASAAAQLGDQARAANSTLTGSVLSSAAQAYAASRNKDDEEGGFDNTGYTPPSGG